MSDSCDKCGRQFGKRRRCYYCAGRFKTGADRKCAVCGVAFYVSAGTARSKHAGSGTYCSRACKHKSQAGRPQPWHDPTKATIHSAGYVMVWMPSHPRASRGRVFEHIVVLEAKIGRILAPYERVHHIDGVRTNNDPGNLELMASDSEHSRHHAEQRRAMGLLRKTVTLTCRDCGSTYVRPRYKADSKYCSRSCRSRAVCRARWHPTT